MALGVDHSRCDRVVNNRPEYPVAEGLFVGFWLHLPCMVLDKYGKFSIGYIPLLLYFSRTPVKDS